jgi:hypothetical protein
MSSKTGKASNYTYGRNKEASISRRIVDHIDGTTFRRNPGSRGPSDSIIYKDGGAKYDVQIKASRASSIGNNTVSNHDIKKLIDHSNNRGTVSLIAESKGNHGTVRYAESGRTMLKY